MKKNYVSPEIELITSGALNVIANSVGDNEVECKDFFDTANDLF